MQSYSEGESEIEKEKVRNLGLVKQKRVKKVNNILTKGYFDNIKKNKKYGEVKGQIRGAGINLL